MQKYQDAPSRIIQAWKVPHVLKGMLTWVPVLNAWRLRRASTGGTDSPRYCYSVWLRHLAMLDLYGFRINGAHIGELGPGDSIGIGLAALLSGASRYVGLDIVPFSAKANLGRIFGELVQLYSREEPIPNENEFPSVRPRLNSYEFPNHLVDYTHIGDRAEKIRGELKAGLNGGQLLSYRTPWTSLDDVAVGTLDLIFSQAVLEHVDSLPETYQAMFAWLKPGGYASHVIDFSAHHLSPFWNGHWAYSDWQWKLVRGKREFLLNREPLSTHLAHAQNAGFQTMLLRRDYRNRGLKVNTLASRFRSLDTEDSQISGAMLILRKP
jgi:SAM-dependent methyltransferase